MRQLLVAEGKKEQTEGSKPMTAGLEGGSRFKEPDGQSITRLGPSSRSGNSFLVGNPNHLRRQALLLFLHCFRLMAIMPLPALLTSSTRLPAQTSQDSYSG